MVEDQYATDWKDAELIPVRRLLWPLGVLCVMRGMLWSRFSGEQLLRMQA
jgi:hypothetical protein